MANPLQDLTTYEFPNDEFMWFKLADILRLCELKESDLKKYHEEITNIRELLDGTKIIRETDAYFLIFFVSESEAVQEAQNWLFNKVLPDIGTKGYYIKGE